MNFEFEIYVSEKTGKKMVYVSCDESSGAEYSYETPEDIGKAIAFYLNTYYPEVVETAGRDMTEIEEE